MYQLVTVRDTIRIPPSLFSESVEESVLAALRQQYESTLDKDIGVVLTVLNPRDLGDGKIIFGDGGAYYDVTFDVLAFKPVMNEVVRGKVVDIAEFGAFVRFGPIDGLVHVSQVTDDFMSYNDKTQMLAGKDSRKILKKGDVVSARIISVSMKGTLTESKVNLTMRQYGLGKKEWYEKGFEKKAVKRTKAEKEAESMVEVKVEKPKEEKSAAEAAETSKPAEPAGENK